MNITIKITYLLKIFLIYFILVVKAAQKSAPLETRHVQ